MEIKYDNTIEIKPSEVVLIISKKLKKAVLVGTKVSEARTLEYDLTKYDESVVEEILKEIEKGGFSIPYFNVDDLKGQEAIIDCFRVYSSASIKVENGDLVCQLLKNMFLERDSKINNIDKKKEELFNYRYSSLRNIINRCFGV